MSRFGDRKVGQLHERLRITHPGAPRRGAQPRGQGRRSGRALGPRGAPWAFATAQENWVVQIWTMCYSLITLDHLSVRRLIGAPSGRNYANLVFRPGEHVDATTSPNFLEVRLGQ
jgi:hypothetical protein